MKSKVIYLFPPIGIVLKSAVGVIRHCLEVGEN